MSKAVIYVRVSTEEQVSNYSLDTQESSCRKYCEDNGLEVLEPIFRDEGFSAKTTNRPKFMEMTDFCLKNAKKRDITAVVVYHTSRFSRTSLDHHVVREMLRTKGITLLSVTENFDDTASGKMIEGISAVFNEFDNNQRSERTSHGMRAAMNKGKWVGTTPAGYVRPADRSHGPSLVPDPVSAALVVEAFELAVDGSRTAIEIWRHAQGSGLLSSRGQPISKQAFCNLLKNEVYTGRIVRPNLGIDVVGDFLPLISADLFAEVQRARSGRTSEILETRRLNHPDFPLRRLIRCSECTMPITGSWSTGRPEGKRYGHYYCRGRGCRGVRVRREELHDLMVAYLDTVSVKPRVVRLLGRVIEEQWSERDAANTSERRRLGRDLGALEVREKSLVNKFLDDQLDKSDFDMAKQRFEVERVSLESRLALLDAETPDLFEIVAFAEHLLSGLSACWNRIDPLSQSVFVAGLFPDGLVYVNGSLGTTESPWFVRALGSFEDDQSSKAPPTGFEPVLPP